MFARIKTIGRHCLAIMMLASFVSVAMGQASTDWLVTAGASGTDAARALTTDGSGDLYVAAIFDESLDLDGDGTSDVSTSLQDGAVAVASLSSDGAFRWATVATVNTSDPDDPFLAAGEAGDVVLASTFSGAADLDGDGTDDVTNDGNEDVVVAAYDDAGTLRWARRIGGSDMDGVDGVAVGGTGDVYVSGFIRGEADFDGDAQPDADGGSLGEMFLAKYDASATLVWIATADIGTNPRVGEVAADVNGNVYVTGVVDGSADFDGDGEEEIGDADAGDAFVAAYSSTGDYRWAIAAGGSGYAEGHDVSAYDGHISVTGSFEETADFDGDGESDVSSTGDEDVFVAQYDADGVMQWVASGGGSEFSVDRGIAVDAAGGSVVVTGRVEPVFGQPTDFDGDGDGDLTQKGNTDILVARYDTEGALQGVFAAGGGASEHGTGIVATSDGGAVVAGFYRGSADFDLDGTEEATATGGSDDNLFVVRYAPTALPAESPAGVADAVQLYAPAPNPVSGETTIPYELPEPAGVTLAVYDVLGQKVVTLVDEWQAAGRKQLRFDAQGLPAGVYLYRLQAGDYVETRRMVLVE